MTVKIDKGTALATLNLTPLIDVVFLLLIFFLVAARYSEEERQLPLQLAEASEARPLIAKPLELYINIDARGRFFVTGKQLTLKELDGVLQTAWVNNHGRVPVIIRADKRGRVESLVAVMNACNKAKLYDYTISTQDTQG